MGTKTNQIVKNIFRSLLFLPFMFLTFCQMDDEDIMTKREALYNIDSNISKLMLQVIDNNNVINKSSGTSDVACTGFIYPITFYAYFGDDPTARKVEVNSDQELLEFFYTIGTTNQYYIFFPVILTDFEGEQTTIRSIQELEGTLQMALDACNEGGDDDNSDDDTGGSDGDDSTGGTDGDNSTGGTDGDNAGDENSNGDNINGVCHPNSKKVTICHKGINICVSVNAIWGHLNQHQEDYLGSCIE
ncbi:MAG: hypothetical protein WBM92_08190 [Aureibaculum sp.]